MYDQNPYQQIAPANFQGNEYGKGIQPQAQKTFQKQENSNNFQPAYGGNNNAFNYPNEEIKNVYQKESNVKKKIASI